MNREKHIFTLRSKMIPSANSLFAQNSVDWWFQDNNALYRQTKKYKNGWHRNM